jgi:hypothetical protein
MATAGLCVILQTQPERGAINNAQKISVIPHPASKRILFQIKPFFLFHVPLL